MHPPAADMESKTLEMLPPEVHRILVDMLPNEGTRRALRLTHPQLKNAVDAQDVLPCLSEVEEKYIEFCAADSDLSECKIAGVCHYVADDGNPRIEDGKLVIMEHAFEDSDIEEVFIPASVSVIGDEAFIGSNVRSVHLDPYSRLKAIHMSAFENCENLTAFPFRQPLKTIEPRAFRGAFSLAKADLTHTMLRSIDASCFEACVGLIAVAFPKTLRIIQKEAFNDCAVLEDVQFHPGCELRMIGDKAFCMCASLKSVSLPRSVEAIAERAFLGCGNLTHVGELPALKSVERHAFSHTGVSPHMFPPSAVRRGAFDDILPVGRKI